MLSQAATIVRAAPRSNWRKVANVSLWQKVSDIGARSPSYRGFHAAPAVLEIKKVPVPSLADSVSEGDISQWTKEVGERVEVDEVVCVLETDKVDIEITSPVAGVITKHLFSAGDSVAVGQELFEIDTEGEATATPAKSAAPPSSEPAAAAPPTPAAPKPTPPPPPAKPAEPAAPKPAAPDAAPASGETRVKMSRMRLRIAERLKEAQNVNAMLTTFNEVDMSNIMAIRKKYKDDFEKKHGIRLGFMSAFMAGAVQALKDQPVINAVIDGSDIVYRDSIDISVAVASPKGLVVPVIRGCNNFNFKDFEAAITAMGKKARTGDIAIEDMTGGTFTISNGGVFGSLMGTPIINPPQSAILGMHGVFDRPVAVAGKVEIRPMMYVALTYDHRLIDGREAVTCLKKIKEVVEDPVRLLLDM